VYPLGAALLAGAVALALSCTRWRRLGQVLLSFVLVGLWIAATPVFADWLNWRVASEVPEPKLKSLRPSDAVIVLGGGEVGRALRALWIYRAGKAPRIVISAGNLPWSSLSVPEAEKIANLLVKLGAPRSALILETRSGTTRENAVNLRPSERWASMWYPRPPIIDGDRRRSTPSWTSCRMFTPSLRPPQRRRRSSGSSFIVFVAGRKLSV
jgi:uncharacterized SAM-binding protein YcdF (DUF218 family)